MKKLTKQDNVVTFKGDSRVITKGNILFARPKITDKLYQRNCNQIVNNCQGEIFKLHSHIAQMTWAEKS